MKKRWSIFAACASLLLLASSLSWSQPELPAPMPSPKASVAQTIGISEVQVNYHRPGVRGRQVWGTLVQYGEVWRAGANENTTISFSTPNTSARNASPSRGPKLSFPCWMLWCSRKRPAAAGKSSWGWLTGDG